MLQQSSHSAVSERVQELLSKSLPPLHRGLLDRQFMKLRTARNANFSSSVFSSGAVSSAMQSLREKKAPRLDSILGTDENSDKDNMGKKKKKKKKKGKKKKKKTKKGFGENEDLTTSTADGGAGRRVKKLRTADGRVGNGVVHTNDARHEGAMAISPARLRMELPPSATFALEHNAGDGGRLPESWNKRSRKRQRPQQLQPLSKRSGPAVSSGRRKKLALSEEAKKSPYMVHEVRAYKKKLRELRRQKDAESMKHVLQDSKGERSSTDTQNRNEGLKADNATENPEAIKGKTLLTIEQEIVAQVDKAFKRFTEEGLTHRRANKKRTRGEGREGAGKGEEGDLALPAVDPRSVQNGKESALDAVRNPSAGFWQRNPRLLRPLDDKKDVATTAASAAALRRPPIATITVTDGGTFDDIGYGTWKTYGDDDGEAEDDQSWQQRDVDAAPIPNELKSVDQVKAFLRDEYWKGIQDAFEARATTIQCMARQYFARRELFKRCTWRHINARARVIVAVSLETSIDDVLDTSYKKAKALSHLRNRLLASTWRRWRSHIDGSAALKRAAQRFFNATVLRCLHALGRAVQRRREFIAHADRHYKWTLQLKAFCDLRRLCARQKRVREILEVALSTRATDTLIVTFAAWRRVAICSAISNSLPGIAMEKSEQNKASMKVQSLLRGKIGRGKAVKMLRTRMEAEKARRTAERHYVDQQVIAAAKEVNGRLDLAAAGAATTGSRQMEELVQYEINKLKENAKELQRITLEEGDDAAETAFVNFSGRMFFMLAKDSTTEVDFVFDARSLSTPLLNKPLFDPRDLVGLVNCIDIDLPDSDEQIYALIDHIVEYRERQREKDEKRRQEELLKRAAEREKAALKAKYGSYGKYGKQKEKNKVGNEDKDNTRTEAIAKAKERIAEAQAKADRTKSRRPGQSSYNAATTEELEYRRRLREEELNQDIPANRRLITFREFHHGLRRWKKSLAKAKLEEAAAVRKREDERQAQLRAEGAVASMVAGSVFASMVNTAKAVRTSARNILGAKAAEREKRIRRAAEEIIIARSKKKIAAKAMAKFRERRPQRWPPQSE